ncbi:unnamed protein product [Clonostachys rosea]|uniref:Uncharacterized protein n=1 Tax=Bionectria ochroleuca TaxID=29856 RepID=A0ABY6U536_BIOOC|nr:unnamed protein product [Clonostachys rosea]
MAANPSPNQPNEMEELLAERREELQMLSTMITQLEVQIQDITAQIAHLVEKYEVNRDFLAAAGDLGRFTSNFSGRAVERMVIDMERGERKVYMDLVVLVANNKNAAEKEAKTLNEKLQVLHTELAEYKATQVKSQEEHDELAAFIAKERAREEGDGPQEVVSREAEPSAGVDDANGTGSIL